MSPSTVRERITKLVELGLIQKTDRYRENGSQTSNYYEVVLSDTPPPPGTPPEVNTPRTKLSRTKLATTSVAGEGNETNKVLEKFQMLLNPTLNYGNKTQRKAAEELVALMGIEKVLNLIVYCDKIQGEEFAPVVTTPYQLKEKSGPIIA